jgi:protein arginine kinase activator
MKCMFCNNQATVHLGNFVNQKKREAHLCEKCARERNLLPDPPAPPIDLKALMNLLMPAAPAAGPVAESACPECGQSFAAFKAEGRFGCAHDYEAFRPVLEPLLERVHRAVSHTGKRPAAARRAEQLVELQTRMKAAIAEENYERAAHLRDLIRQTEAEGTAR